MLLLYALMTGSNLVERQWLIWEASVRLGIFFGAGGSAVFLWSSLGRRLGFLLLLMGSNVLFALVLSEGWLDIFDLKKSLLEWVVGCLCGLFLLNTCLAIRIEKVTPVYFPRCLELGKFTLTSFVLGAAFYLVGGIYLMRQTVQLMCAALFFVVPFFLAAAVILSRKQAGSSGLASGHMLGFGLISMVGFVLLLM